MWAMDELVDDAAARAKRYWKSLDERRVSPAPDAIARLTELEEPFPADQSDARQTLALLDEIGSSNTVATAGPRFFGFVIGGALPATVAASWLASAWDQNAGLRLASPIDAKLEEVALGWMVEALGLPAGTGAGFVSGATMANFTALLAARHAILERAGWNVESDGLFGAPPVTVVVGDEAHPTLMRSLSMAGFGHQRVLRLPVDGQGRISAENLPRLDGPTIVCIQAGNVNTGAFDPAEELCAWAHEQGAWVHVDGAFGLWAAAAPDRAHLMRGFNQADSWATDAHKWLNVPYDSGLAFVRDPEQLRRALSLSAAYLPQAEAREPSQFTPELSRRARGIEVWAALKTLGRAGLAELIERNCRQATRFAEGLRDAGYAILTEVVLNQVLVSFGAPERTRAVIAAIQDDGTCWCGPTIWHEQTAMRISVSSWRTTDEDVERSLAAMIRIAREA
jgi:glutamate/tyrosine decarboxylase-like PLP-dependent enzyme